MKLPFRGFNAILYKEFLVVLRDPLTLFFMFFPPLIEMIAFGYALDNDVKHMAMVVLNEDRTVESRQLIDRFVNTQTFRVVGEVQSVDEMAAAIRQGKAYIGLQIPPNFTRDLHAGRNAQVQVLIDGSSSTIASSALNTALGVSFRESVFRLLGETGRRELPVDVRPQILFNPAMRSPNFFVPGVAGLHARAKSNPGPANEHGVHHAVGVFLRLHLPARNHALDFLRDWLAASHDLFHRTGAGRHSSRRESRGLLATPRDSRGHGPGAVCALRAAVQEEDWLGHWQKKLSVGARISTKSPCV